MRYREKKDDLQAIDITPMIDMVFLLLIFFMVSTTFVKDMKLDLERPKANSAVTASSKAIRLFIDCNGDTYLDGEPVRLWLIQSKLRDLLSTSSNKIVLVVTETAAVNELPQNQECIRQGHTKRLDRINPSEIGPTDISRGRPGSTG